MENWNGARRAIYASPSPNFSPSTVEKAKEREERRGVRRDRTFQRREKKEKKKKTSKQRPTAHTILSGQDRGRDLVTSGFETGQWR